MISWLTTEEPKTFFASTRSEALNETVGGTRIAYASTNHETLIRETSQNWSRTTIAEKNTDNQTATGTYEIFPEGTTITTSSYSTAFQTQESQQSVFSLTKTRNIQTSTTQSVPCTFYITTTKTKPASGFTTSKNSEDKIEFVPTYGVTSAIGQKSYPATSSATVTTQLNETEFDPDLYATVCRADKANELIWVLPTSLENPARAGFVAATNLAASGEEVTLRPWTVMAPLVVIGDALQTGAENEKSTYCEFSGIIGVTTTEQRFETSVLPWQGSQNATFTGSTASQSFSSTMFEAQYVLATKTAVQERVATVPKLSPAYFNGGYNVTGNDLIGAEFVTGNFYKSDTNARVSFSLVSNAPNVNRTEVRSCRGVGYALKPQAMTTAIGSTALIRLGLVGPLSGEKVAGYLQCPNVGTVAGNYLVSANRENAGSSSIFPGTYGVQNQTGKGTIIFSGLSASVTVVNTTNFNEETSSFVVGLGGEPGTSQIQHNRVMAGAVAAFESCAVTVSPGVFSSVCGERSGTFSTSGGARSFTTTSGSSSFVEPISFVCPAGTNEDMGHVVWTVNRNQTDLPTA